MTWMAVCSYTDKFATSIIGQIRDFAEYGFPKSYTASFAPRAYAPSWLKYHEPATLLDSRQVFPP